MNLTAAESRRAARAAATAYQLATVRHYYGPRTVATTEPGTYPTRAAARAEIERRDRAIYYLSPGEHSRPTYRIRRARDGA